jgi:hypothetical protein
MERHGSIYSGFSWHIFHMSRALNPVNCKYVGRPQMSSLSYGVYPVCLEDETNAFSDMAMRFLARAGMVEKDERMILIEDESHDDMPETLLMKIFKI